MNKPEVLAPAGNMEKLIMAVEYGADAVYLAGTMFGMRAGTDNFTRETLKDAINLCHSRGVNVYVTVNTIPTQDEIVLLPEYLEYLGSISPDAVILADIGVMNLVKKYAPGTAIHISTQAGVMNSETAKAFYDLGASRVVLARETSLESIRKLRQNIPSDLQIEAFCHGAMCVSFSGRCVISNYLTGRDANRGQCAQPCRWKYRIAEEKTPNEWMDITEDGGTYLYNSKDMCMIDYVREMAEAGVSALKIEGRTKSSYYVASTTAAYRSAVDYAVKGEPLPQIWRDEVYKVSHRPYSTGFYFTEPGQHTADSQYITDYDVAAVVDSCDAEGNAVMHQRNKFYPGDTLEILSPGREPVSFTAGSLFDENMNPIEDTRHPNMLIHTKLPFSVPANSFLRKKRG